MTPLFWAGLPVEWKRIQFTKGMYLLATQLGPTLCGPMNWSPPDSSVHGIFQARILKWVAIPFSRRSPQPSVELESFVSPASAGGFFTPCDTWGSVAKFKDVNIQKSAF